MKQVVCMGEALIDFTPHGLSEQGMPLYEMNPGGACANVACTLASYGVPTTFVGKVGMDRFGAYLSETLKQRGVDIAGLIADAKYNTTLTFVHLAEDGDRSFSFIRRPGADTALLPHELNHVDMEQAELLHFGAVCLTDNPSRDTILAAAAQAKAAGKMVSFDPNLRQDLWANLELAKATIQRGLTLCSVLKVSEEELYFLTNSVDLEGAAESLYNSYHIPIILVTLGARGAYYHTPAEAGYAPGYPQPKTVDTTGAGDCFMGSFLYQLLCFGADNLKGDNLRYAIDFANAAAGLSTGKRGAIPSIPAVAEVQALMNFKG